MLVPIATYNLGQFWMKSNLFMRFTPDRISNLYPVWFGVYCASTTAFVRVIK